MNETKRVIVLGLDGACWDVLDPLIEKGIMPNLKRLKQESSWGDLKSSMPPTTALAWPCFYTGKNPGKHGLMEFLYTDYDYKNKLSSNKDIKADSLWKMLDHMGKKCAIIHVPTTYPPESLENGVIVAGMLTPSENSDYTMPKKFKSQLKKIVPGYRVHSLAYKPGKEEEFVEDLKVVLGHRFALMEYFMKQEQDYDFIMCVISGTDKIHHAMSKYIDPSHFLYTEEKDRFYKPLFENYFRELDGWIGKMLENLKKDDLLFMMSDHGSGKCSGIFGINRWLHENGYLKTKKTPLTLKKTFIKMGINKENIVKITSKHKLKWAEKIARKVISPNVIPRAEKITNENIDFMKTKAFKGPAGILFNEKGRFKNGFLSKKDIEKLKKRIKKELKDNINPFTEKKLKINIFEKEALYQGPNAERASDLILNIEDQEIRTFPEKDKIFERISEFGASGSHRMNGIFLVKGENIKKNKKISITELTDFVPTYFHVSKIKLPPDMDGELIKEVFKGK
ncbi:MAG: alkaline phosphatase family protein [archaeon]